LAETYVVVAGVLELAPPVAAVPLLELLLELPPQAATVSPADAITAMADSREQLRSKPISFLLRLVKADGDQNELGCCRLARGEGVEVA